MKASTSWDDVAFSSTEGDRHLGIRPVSQLNTWPAVSPVNASRRPSRYAAHHSGSGRMASPYPMGDFHLLFFASFLAHSDLGHSRRSDRRPVTSGLPLPDIPSTVPLRVLSLIGALSYARSSNRDSNLERIW